MAALKSAPTHAAAPAAAAARTPSLLHELEATRPSLLEPLAFFVAWQGVPTLAFSGFTEALVDLKQRIAAAHPSLPPENPGSRWPKTTLGCLRDGHRLSPEELETMQMICRELSAEFQQQQQQQPPQQTAAEARGGLQLIVDSASITLFTCRSLERMLSCQAVAFPGALDTSPPPAQERARVAAILAEPEHPDYWFCASRDGNREAHYRGPHLGATLMHPLALSRHGEATDRARSIREAAHRAALLSLIERFRTRVDLQLPDMYVWFNDSSLHITLRALIN